MRRFLAPLVAAALLAAATPSWAQRTWPDPAATGVVIGQVPMCVNTSAQAVLCTGYPSASTPIGGNASGTTGAVVGTLAAAAGKTTSICGFDVSAIGGTAAVGPIVIAGLVGGSATYQMSSSAAGNTLSRTFTPCISGSGVNTAITITTTADGTATAVNVNSWGYQQ